MEEQKSKKRKGKEERKEGMKMEGKEEGRRRFTNETHLAFVQLLFISWFYVWC